MKLKIFILFISLSLFSCKEFKEISVTKIEGFYINKLTTDNLEAEMKLKINNPNNIGFSIYPSEFDVIFSGISLGKAKLNKQVHIDAKSEKVYSFILNKNLGDLNPFDALKLLSINNLGKLEVTRNLNVGKYFLKKEYPIHYSDKVNLFK